MRQDVITKYRKLQARELEAYTRIGKWADGYRSTCASGTWETDGLKILQAVRKQNMDIDSRIASAYKR
jgi:hypothetical protein